MDWNEYFINMLPAIAAKSKDPDTKVGAIAVSDNHSILTTGFNDFPRGVYHNVVRYEKPSKYIYIEHAEANLINNAARNGIKLEGSTLYVSFMPCHECMKSIIGAGIKRIFYDWNNFSKLMEKYCFSIDYAVRICRNKERHVHYLNYFAENSAEWIKNLSVSIEMAEESNTLLIPYIKK